MRRRIKYLFVKYYALIKYVFFGLLATLVNVGIYYILRMAFDVNLIVANTVSVSAAIVFAFFTNSFFVFESKAKGFKEHLQEFVKFVCARLSTMLIEVWGVWFIAEIVHIDDRIGKLIIQFVILVLNYLFSKFLVFTR